MRRRRHAFQFSVEPLEVRVLPAAVTVSKGAMTIKNQVGELTVETTDVANQIRVTDDSGSFLYDGVKSKITVVGTNNNDAINVHSGFGWEVFGGSLSVQSGRGDDVVFVTGEFGGNVALQTGLGDDVVSSAGDLWVAGNLTISDTSGLNVVTIDNDEWFIGNSMSATGVSVFSVAGEGSLNVWGSLSISALSSSGGQLTSTFNGSALNVGGNLKITGGYGVDNVVIASELRVGGSATFNMRSGDSVLTLMPQGEDSGILGALSYTGGSAWDSVVTGNLFVGGNATFNLGGGLNFLTVIDTTEFHGSVAINGGSGQNLSFLDGHIAGNLSVKYAGGLGSTTMLTGTVGRTFTYRSGNATFDAVGVDLDQSLINVDILYGSGQHSLQIQVPYTGKIVGSKGAVIGSFLV